LSLLILLLLGGGEAGDCDSDLDRDIDLDGLLRLTLRLVRVDPFLGALLDHLRHAIWDGEEVRVHPPGGGWDEEAHQGQCHNLDLSRNRQLRLLPEGEVSVGRSVERVGGIVAVRVTAALCVMMIKWTSIVARKAG